MIGAIIGAVVLGLIVGALARAVLPGKQSLSLGRTIALGVIANLAVTIVLAVIFDSGAGRFLSVILGVLVAIGLLVVADRQGWVKTV